MAERTNATVLKTVEVQASGGSNPPPSAIGAPAKAGVPYIWNRASERRCIECCQRSLYRTTRSQKSDLVAYDVTSDHSTTR